MVPTMRAVHCTRYGPPDVLKLREVAKPVPKAGEILVRVHAATVTLGDCEIRAFKMVSWVWLPARLAIGITKPRQPVLGMEVAGEVVALGEDVTRFKVGDRVFGPTGFGMGAYADYALLPQTASVTNIPPGVTMPKRPASPPAASMAFTLFGNVHPGRVRQSLSTVRVARSACLRHRSPRHGVRK